MFAHVFKFNANHDHLGRFAKAPGNGNGPLAEQGVSLEDYAAKHDQAGVTAEDIYSQFPKDRREIAASVARANNLTGTNVLYSRNKDGTGGYTSARKALHREIITSILSPENIAAATPKKGKRPVLVILGGRGGSGKSAFTHSEKGDAKIKEFDSRNMLVLDTDAIKAKLRPPYKGWNAACVHEESDYIFESINSMAKELGLNIVRDATLKSNKLQPTIDAFKAEGYDVEGHYMFVPRQEAARRAVSRYLGKGKADRSRLVPAETVLSNVNNEKNFDLLKHNFTKWSAYDNQGSGPVLINRGSNKK